MEPEVQSAVLNSTRFSFTVGGIFNTPSDTSIGWTNPDKNKSSINQKILMTMPPCHLVKRSVTENFQRENFSGLVPTESLRTQLVYIYII